MRPNRTVQYFAPNSFDGGATRRVEVSPPVFAKEPTTLKSVDSLDSEEEQLGKEAFRERLASVSKQLEWRSRSSRRLQQSMGSSVEMSKRRDMDSSQYEALTRAQTQKSKDFFSLSQTSSFKMASSRGGGEKKGPIYKSRFHQNQHEDELSSDSQSGSCSSDSLPNQEGPSIHHVDATPVYGLAPAQSLDEQLAPSAPSPESPPPNQEQSYLSQPNTINKGTSLTESCHKSVERKMMLTMRELVIIQLADLLIYSSLHFFFHASHSDYYKKDDGLEQDGEIHHGEQHTDDGHGEHGEHGDFAIEFSFELLISILITLLLTASTYFKKPQYTKYTVGLMFLRVIMAQLFIHLFGEHFSVLEQQLVLSQNFVRCTISLLISQFLTNKALKLVCSFLHYLVSVGTMVAMVQRSGMLEYFLQYHKLDIIIIGTTFAFVEFIIFRIFDASQQASILSSLYIAKCQEQTSSILQGIKTGIISREMTDGSANSVHFCNQFAFSILGEEGHWEEFKNQEGEVISSDNPISKEAFHEIIQRQLFTYYAQDKADQKADPQRYSLLDFFDIEPSKLLDSVYFTEQGTEEPKRIYVRIHKGAFSTQGVQFESLEIQDVSREFVTSQGEKKLLSLINATVSHEMRTPINSINSQNIEMRYLIEKIEELLEKEEVEAPVFKEKLKRFQQQLAHSSRIHHSSTKFLTFVINDMLDLSQLKQGKFRKIPRLFNLEQAVNQIVSVQDYKAEQMGVKIKVKFDGFPLDEEDIPKHVICTDEQRLQQVLMNLVSNALKFTPSGGYIFIFCRFMPGLGKSFGRIQISVQDTGIGIKKEDQRKLFKLFGFLDTTKELNTQGIGLGLHICQMITNFFGGTMTCESQPGQGAKFTFDFFLDDPHQDKKNSLNGRCHNPNSKIYPKFLLSRRADSDQFNEVVHTSPISRLKRPVYRPISTIFSPDKRKEESCDRRKSQLRDLNTDRFLAPNSSYSSASISMSMLDRLVVNSNRSRMSSQVKRYDPIPCKEIEGKRILVADDEPFNIAALEILLRQSGFEGILEAVDFAMNGLEAVKLVKKGIRTKSYSYGLILMDCSMPVQDGFETSDEIRFLCLQAKIAQPKIVACTGHCEPKYIEKAWRHNMDEFMAKPIKPSALNDLLEDLIQQP